MANRARKYAVSIHKEGQDAPIGTGCVVTTSGAVVTCAHVARDAGMDPTTGGPCTPIFWPFQSKSTLRITYPQRSDRNLQESPAELIRALPTGLNDGLILLFPTKKVHIPTRDLPSLGTAIDSDGHLFESYGFRSLGRNKASPATGTIIGYGEEGPGQHPLVFLTSQNISGGMSGAPVHDKALGLLVGIIKSQWNAGAHTSDRDTAWAFDIGDIFSVRDDLDHNGRVRTEALERSEIEIRASAKALASRTKARLIFGVHHPEVSRCLNDELRFAFETYDRFDFRNYLAIGDNLATGTERAFAQAFSLHTGRKRKPALSHFAASKPLTLCTSVSLLGPVAIFTHLRHRLSLSIELTLTQTLSTGPLRNAMSEEGPYDLIVLPLSSAQSYLSSVSNPPYWPVQLMPRGTNSLLKTPAEHYELFDPSCTSPVVSLGELTGKAYADRLTKIGLLASADISNSTIPVGDGRQAIEAIRAGISVSAFFPYNGLIDSIVKGSRVDLSHLEVSSTESILFVRRSLVSKPGFVEDLRYWIDVSASDLSEQLAREQVVDTLMGDANCGRVLYNALSEFVQLHSPTPAKGKRYKRTGAIDSMSRIYTSRYDSQLLRGEEEQRPWNLQEKIASYLTEDSWLIDVGCGTGVKTIPCAKELKKYVGVEPSEEMRRRAVELAGSLGLSNVEIRNGFAAQLPIEDAAFDILTSFLAIHSASEFARVLKKGGVAVVEKLSDIDKREFKAFFGSDTDGPRGQFGDLEPHSRRQLLTEEFQAHFSKVSVIEGEWEAFLSPEGVLALCQETSLIRNFCAEKDRAALEKAIETLSCDRGVRLVHRRMLLVAIK